MKIAFIVPSLKYAGPLIVVENIINRLLEKNEHEITIYYFKEIIELKVNVKIIKIKLLEYIDFSNYDIVHSHMFRPDLYFYFWSLFGKNKHVKAISTIHQFISHDFASQHSFFKAKLASKIWHQALKRYNVLVTLNEEMKSDYQKKYPTKKVVKIHNGIDINNTYEMIQNDDLKKITKLKTRYKLIGSAAQITKNKCFNQVIDLLTINSNIAFILIGDGPELNNLKKRAIKNGVSNRVLFLGHRANAKKYFTLFDIFIMSSEKEGFPISLLEAASLSIPAVCSRNKVFEELYENSDVSFFEMNNIVSLNEAVIKILNNTNLYKRNIYLKYKNSYTSSIMTNNYLKLYKQLNKNEK